MTFAGWNYGDLADALAAVTPPDHPVLIHGERVTTNGDFTRRTNNLAAALLAGGARTGDKVAFYMRNHPAYLEGLFAACKARLVHVNINYRYIADEVRYILDNSDAAVVVFAREFAPIIDEIRHRLPKVTQWIVVEDGADEPTPEFAAAFDDLADEGDGAPLNIARSPDDLFFLYTGGTTGMPKAVMWRQDSLRRALLNPALVARMPTDIADHLEIVREAGRGPINMPACPLMHGTGLFTAVSALIAGGTVVILETPHFDPHELWDVVARHRVEQIVIVGDAFAKPMLRDLDDEPGARDLSSVIAIISSGVMWSQEVKHGLLRHLPQAALMDSFGSSEAVGFGLSVTTMDGEVGTARFQIGDNVKVFNADGREVAPGGGEVGLIARGDPLPEGYYKDQAKTDATFPMIGGVRYAMPGDHCTVEVDGSITLLGRGSGCINTAGEKVFPEEVEEVLKLDPDVEDALVVGTPDEKWGQAVTAVVEMREGVTLDDIALRAHARAHLAGYKTPKHFVAVDRMFRAPNGKADYKSAREAALRALASNA